jgi:hypothetical protein
MFDVECCVPSTLESVEKNRTYLYSPYRFNGGAGVDSTVPVMYRYLSFTGMALAAPASAHRAVNGRARAR